MPKTTDGTDARHRPRDWLRRSAQFFALASMAATVWATPEGLAPIAIGAIQRDAGPDDAAHGEKVRNDREIEVAAKGASYPLTIDRLLTGPTTLTASDTGAFHWFGRSVSLSRDGNTALIGAPPNTAAYVFVRQNGNWVQKQKLRRPSGLSCIGADSFFGASVALSADGKTALIGASGTINLGVGIVPIPFKISCLEALVYVESGNRWRLFERLRGRGVQTGDLFGSAVALSAKGTTALIGAESTECPGSTEDCGAAYLFEREATGWRQRKRFQGASPFAEELGTSVALSADGKWALAGTESNSVLAFKRNKRSWRLHSTITVANSRTGDDFGEALALSAKGQRALIGAVGVECFRGPNCGLTYTFVRQGGAWIEEDRLAPADLDGGYQFGEALVLSRNGLRAIIGASGADCPNGNCGAAYVFDREGGDWVEKDRVTSPTAGLGGAFGGSVATSGDGRTVLVGAHLENCAAGQDCGAVYAYSRSD